MKSAAQMGGGRRSFAAPDAADFRRTMFGGPAIARRHGRHVNFPTALAAKPRQRSAAEKFGVVGMREQGKSDLGHDEPAASQSPDAPGTPRGWRAARRQFLLLRFDVAPAHLSLNVGPFRAPAPVLRVLAVQRREEQ